MHLSDLMALLAAHTHHPIVRGDHERSASADRARRLSREATHRIHLRCLTPTDAHRMSDLVERLSPQSRYQRYFRLVRSFAPADIARFVAVSPAHLAVGAFDGDALVGAAQYFRFSTCPDHAEVAVEVADSHHRRRVAARLVQELARLAAHEGITHFTATVLAENRPVLELMRHSGWDIATTLDGSYADVVVTLPAELVGAAGRCDKTRAGPANPRSTGGWTPPGSAVASPLVFARPPCPTGF
ncbi:MAG: GNAT family N-acetyltransferase [Pseudolysinimonas sp.]